MKKKTSSRVTKPNWYYVAIVVLVLLLIGATTWALIERNQSQQRQRTGTTNTSPAATLDEHGITPLDTAQASNNATTAEELAYLIEEEKLAHDVYQAMHAKWNARVFDTIKNSETTHQAMVLGVMQSRGLPDPRYSEVGKFKDPSLQSLYDGLIAKGNHSLTEAYQVGITIEEKDIADLKDILARLDPKDTDIKAALENLLQGSENHLRAFNRQANR